MHFLAPKIKITLQPGKELAPAQQIKQDAVDARHRMSKNISEGMKEWVAGALVEIIHFLAFLVILGTAPLSCMMLMMCLNCGVDIRTFRKKTMETVSESIKEGLTKIEKFIFREKSQTIPKVICSHHQAPLTSER